MSPSLVNPIRQQLLHLLDNDDHKLFDQRDRVLIAQNDFFIERFIKFNQSSDVNETRQRALASLIGTLKWRKVEQVNDISGHCFPAEAFKFSPHSTGRNKDGRLTFSSRIGLIRPQPEWEEMNHKLAIYRTEQFGLRESALLFLDFSDWSGNTLSRPSGQAGDLVKHYPCLIKYTYITGLPCVLRPVLNSLVTLLPKKYSSNYSFISKSEANKMMGTQCQFPVPENCLPLDKAAEKYGISSKGVENVKKIYKEIAKSIGLEKDF